MKQAAFALLLLLAAAAFMALGIWQVERLAWKRALIAQTDFKLAQAPVVAPAPAEWPMVDMKSVYTRVAVSGYYQPSNTLVAAATRYGRGYWVLTPLQTAEGFTVLVNRGFITPEQKAALITPPGRVAVTGLLRLTEPKGSLLQHNNPQEGRWYSRDVQAITARGGFGDVAPYFIDADASGTLPPIGGLTVVSFANNHLQYALTWFGLALLAGLGLLMLLMPGLFSRMRADS